MASLSGLSIDLDLLDFLALGILVPWALAWAKDTFRYVGHCGLVFEEFRFFGPRGLDFGFLLVGSLSLFYLISGERKVDTVWSLVFTIFLFV